MGTRVKSFAGNEFEYNDQNRAHLGPTQDWTIVHQNEEFHFYLAHPADFEHRPAGAAPVPMQDGNRFFFKHIMLPSKTGNNAKKESNRMASRMESKKKKKKWGNKNRLDRNARLTHFQKYGGDKPESENNTIIDLSAVTPETVARKFAEVIGASVAAAAWRPADGPRKLRVGFDERCVHTADYDAAAIADDEDPVELRDEHGSTVVIRVRRKTESGTPANIGGIYDIDHLDGGS